MLFPILLRISGAIDRMSGKIGRATSWLAALMVMIGAANAILRYLARDLGLELQGNAALEAQWYLFSLLFLLGAPWALQQNAHVRVDVIYGRLGRRARTWIDLVGGLLFLLPFCGFALYFCWPSVLNSWAVWEVSQDPGGLPRYPIKSAILVCFSLVALQGVSELIRNAARLRGHLPSYDAHGDAPREDA